MKSFIAVFAFLLLSVCVINARLFTDDQYRTAFSAWMETHNKVYRADEYVKRFEIFQDNMDYVHNWNSQNLPTVLGLNFLADLTNEEYQRLYLGTRFTAPRVNIQNSLNKQPRMVLPQTYRPDNNTVDWRVKGAVTPIKDQGQCGSCWSFSTTGSVEGINKISTGNLVSLSEQNLMDCSTAYGNMGCNGGLMTSAFQYIIDNGGIDTEASYPYKMARFNCNFSTINIGAKISGYKNIPSGNEIALASAVNVQPVSVAIDASHNSFQLYQSGIYYEPKCSSNNLDHGVLAIGYGDAGGAGTEYWIVKNSWGTSWGMMGFINMARDFNNQCGIASMASFPTM